MKPQFYIIFLISSLLQTICYAQVKDLDELISKRTADSLGKVSFARMVTGTDNVTNLANYVSFVPSDGKFTLSGNYFFKTDKPLAKKRKSEYFAVGFNGSGSILGETIAPLFESGTLNTGVDVGIKFSWRMNKPSIGSIESETLDMIEKREALEIEKTHKIDSVKNFLSLTFLKLRQTELSISATEVNLRKLGKQIKDLSESFSKCNTDTCFLRFTDSLIIVKSKIFTEEQKIIRLKNERIALMEIIEVTQIVASTKWEDRTPREQYLSMKYGLKKINLSYEDIVVDKIKKVYDDKIYAVEMARPISGMRLNWLSAVVNWNRFAFRTYYDSLPFQAANTKTKKAGLTLGLQANFYSLYKPVRKASLLNIALLFKKTNNLEELTASKLVEEETTIEGFTTRKLTNEYSVYTDPVKIYNTIQLPVNYYRFFGKELNFGWHLFALADWRNTKDNLYDLGAGFIFGLNSPGAKRLFNVEIFANYKDVTQELVIEDQRGWKQFQLGLSVAVPFIINKN